jgi:predicted nucleic acid-binding protein
MNIFIDTQIWIYAIKSPSIENVKDPEKYAKMEQYHKISEEFLTTRIVKDLIYMTNHQLCEIYHGLAYRGNKTNQKYAKEYCNALIEAKFIKMFNISNTDVRIAMEMSQKSNIHLWDFLCIIPFYQKLDVIYSSDLHFTEQIFTELGPKIENPLDKWMLL